MGTEKSQHFDDSTTFSFVCDCSHVELFFFLVWFNSLQSNALSSSLSIKWSIFNCSRNFHEFECQRKNFVCHFSSLAFRDRTTLTAIEHKIEFDCFTTLILESQFLSHFLYLTDSTLFWFCFKTNVFKITEEKCVLEILLRYFMLVGFPVLESGRLIEADNFIGEYFFFLISSPIQIEYEEIKQDKRTKWLKKIAREKKKLMH